MAPLKPRYMPGRLMRGERFPRSEGRGSIEALQRLHLSSNQEFPRSEGRGSIEAKARYRSLGTALHAFPRSEGRGSIEAV